MKRLTLILLTALIFGSSAYADTVYLDDESTVTGKILQYIPIMKIKTDDGEVMLDWSTIRKVIAEHDPKTIPSPPFETTMPPSVTVPVEIRTVPIKKKNVLLTLPLSLIIPGSGQIYNGDYFDGVVHLLAAGFCWDNYISWDSNFSLFCALTIHAISAIDAPLSAYRKNKNTSQVKFGHLIEIPGDRYTLGIDPITFNGGFGSLVSFRF